MAALDTRPGVVDVTAYAGDTLTLAVQAPAELVDGLVWSAQVRTTRDAETVADEFTITPPVAGGPAYLTLPAAVTRALAETGTQLRAVRAGRSVTVLRFTGEWDVQVAGVAGADPVTTLAQGTLTLDLDVTRDEP